MNKNTQKPNNQIKRVLELVDELLEIPSVIGNEKPFLDHLNKRISALGYQTTQTDKYLVIKPKNTLKKLRFLFSAHIDRHGLILNEEQKLEYLAYHYKKQLKLKFKRDTPDFYLSCAQRHTNEKISSYNTITGKKINSYSTKRYELDWKNKDVFFDTNKKILTKKEKIFMFDSKITINKNEFFAQIDNVISVAVLIHLFEQNKINQEIIFTTKEEIGKSYLNVINYLKNEKKEVDLIVLDTSPYENFNNKETGFLVLRKGDENGNFNLNLVNQIKSILKINSIPYNFKSSKNGMTELGRISSQTKGKINGTTLQLPSKNYHTTYETSTFESLENYIKIIKELNK